MSTSIGLEDIARIIGVEPVTPIDPTLYEQALTHRSSGEANYQRLEFLGDRVLGLTIATELYNRFPGASEGELAARFSMLVSGETCANVARMIALPERVKLGTQAVKDGVRSSDNITADLMESLIGALYLDQGLDIARSFILRHWRSLIDEQHATPKHPKAELQEWAVARKYRSPQYEVISRDGLAHSSLFQVEVRIGKLHRAEAEGYSKQSAEKSAAQKLLERLKKLHERPKIALEEWARAHKHSPPKYEVIAQKGDAHASNVRVKVSIGKIYRAKADGSNKQRAEKAAAQNLLEQLNNLHKHPKTALQEWAHVHKHNLPKYKVIAQEDEAHSSHVRVVVSIGELHHAEAEGSNKQNAEKAAAKQLLEQLGET